MIVTTESQEYQQLAHQQTDTEKQIILAEEYKKHYQMNRQVMDEEAKSNKIKLDLIEIKTVANLKIINIHNQKLAEIGRQ